MIRLLSLLLILPVASFATVLPKRPTDCSNVLSVKTSIDDAGSFVQGEGTGSTYRTTFTPASNYATGTSWPFGAYAFYWPSAPSSPDQWACVRINSMDTSANSGNVGMLLRVDPLTRNISINDTGGTLVVLAGMTGSGPYTAKVVWAEELGTYTAIKESAAGDASFSFGDWFCSELTGTGSGQSLDWWIVPDSSIDEGRCRFGTNATDSGTLTPTSPTPANDGANGAHFVGINTNTATDRISGLRAGNGQGASASDAGWSRGPDVKSSWGDLTGVTVVFAEDWDSGPEQAVMGNCQANDSGWSDSGSSSVGCVTDPRGTESDSVLEISTSNQAVTLPISGVSTGTQTCFLAEIAADAAWSANSEDMFQFKDGVSVRAPAFETAASSKLVHGGAASPLTIDTWAASQFETFMFQNDWDTTENETDNWKDYVVRTRHSTSGVGAGAADDAVDLDGFEIKDSGTAGSGNELWVDTILFYSGAGCPWGIQ